MTSHRLHWSHLCLFLSLMLVISPPGWARDEHHSRISQDDHHNRSHQDDHRNRISEIVIPEEDRFTPFSLTIHVGDTVKWINQDTDDHTVVSDDVFNTVGKTKHIDHLLLGTDNTVNHQPGMFSLRFNSPGTFVFYCRFHSHLDGSNQPVAPGLGQDANNAVASGIQQDNSGIPSWVPAGNFGTPMSGVVTVLPDRDNGHMD
jgi:plastocyanin